MKRYRIALTRSATKELDRLPPPTHDKIIDGFAILKMSRACAGPKSWRGLDAYKLRVGNFRIVYQIDEAEKVVRIVMVDDRKQVYQRLRRKS